MTELIRESCRGSHTKHIHSTTWRAKRCIAPTAHMCANFGLCDESECDDEDMGKPSRGYVIPICRDAGVHAMYIDNWPTARASWMILQCHDMRHVVTVSED